MDESARSNRIRRERLIEIFTAVIILVAVFGVVAYRYYDNGITSITRTPSTSSSTIAMSTINISSSTNLASIEIAENSSGITFDTPTLDPNTGQIYALTSTQNGTNRLLTSFNTTSLVYRTVQALPGTGVGIAVDPTTYEIYVAVAPTPCNPEPTSNICYSNQGGVLRVNGSTGVI